MAATFLETELENLLKLKLVGTKKQIQELLDYNGPLGTFSSKIKFSYALGLISKTSFQDLEIIRNIRNDFGHSYALINFSTRSIYDRIINLKSYYRDKKGVANRDIFLGTVMVILSSIHFEINNATKFVEKKDLEITAEEKKNLSTNLLAFAQEIISNFGIEGTVTLTTENIQLIAEKFATADTLKWK